MPFNELPGPNTSVTPCALSVREHQHLTQPAVAQLLHHAREQREVRTAEQRQTDSVDIFLQRGLRDLLGSLMQAGVDDLEAMVAQGASDGLRATIVAVEARLGDDYAVGPIHK